MDWIQRVSALRKQIFVRSNGYRQNDQANVDDILDQRSKRKFKPSTKSKDPENLSAAERNRLEILDGGNRHRMKRRKLKDLSIDEQEEIVQQYEEAEYSGKDIAERFLITPSLVSKLGKRAERDPDWINPLIQKEQMQN